MTANRARPAGLRRPGLVILLATLGLTQHAAAGDTEPNDNIDSAQMLGVVDGERGGVVEVSFRADIGNGSQATRDVDVFRIDTLVPWPLSVQLTCEVRGLKKTVDPYLRLFDSTSAELLKHDDVSISDRKAVIQTYLVDNGTYYIGVSDASNPLYAILDGDGRDGGTGPYQLYLRAEAVVIPPSPDEPNDSTTEATDVGLGSFSRNGFIGDGSHGHRDVDVYRLTLTEAARIHVEVVGEAGIVPVLDPVVRIRTCADPVEQPTYPDRCLAGEMDDQNTGDLNPSFSVGIPGPEELFIIVSGAGNIRFNPAATGSGEPGSTGAYELIVTVTPVVAAGENIPNESIRQAIPLPEFNPSRPELVEVDAMIGDGAYAQLGGDRDVYAVEMDWNIARLTVDVEAETISSYLDPVLSVFDGDGNLVETSDNEGDSRDAQVILPTFCTPTTRDARSAYVMISGSGQRPPTNPFLPDEERVAVPPRRMTDGPGSTGAYRLRVSASPDVPRCPGEPDNTLVQATDTGLYASGVFLCTGGQIGDSKECPSGDVDVWSLQVSHAPAVVVAQLGLCDRGFGLQMAVRVFDEGANLLATAETDHLGNRETARLRAYLQTPGKYYVVVSGSQMIDPTNPCQNYYPDNDVYHLAVQLFDASVAPQRSQGPVEVSTEAFDGKLFATRIDPDSSFIDLIDAATGKVVVSLPSPEPIRNGIPRIAFDGTDLYFMGSGWYPELYRLNPFTGETIERLNLWAGSGLYSDMTILDRELFILDAVRSDIHVLELDRRRFSRTLDVDAINNIKIGSSLAALARPNRLLAGDAAGSGRIHEIHPVTGLAESSIVPPATPTGVTGLGQATVFVSNWLLPELSVMSRSGTHVATHALEFPIGSLASHVVASRFGDANGDHGVNLDDFEVFASCMAGPSVYPGACTDTFDANADLRVDLADFGPMQILLRQ